MYFHFITKWNSIIYEVSTTNENVSVSKGTYNMFLCAIDVRKQQRNDQHDAVSTHNTYTHNNLLDTLQRNLQ